MESFLDLVNVKDHVFLGKFIFNFKSNIMYMYISSQFCNYLFIIINDKSIITRQDKKFGLIN